MSVWEYRKFIKRTAPDRQLYLAMSQRIYQVNFDETFQIVVEENQLKLIIVDPDKEVITKSIK
ncbi:element excision factor XisH family protein [Aerosakkonema sp. BLCC-F183]|uniref:element excision factor XisH family protein n=1 Tax=Aerosakkonema sp. BLCC-F183 TaxID=3342834 RepID=UPI0035BA3DBD